MNLEPPTLGWLVSLQSKEIACEQLSVTLKALTTNQEGYSFLLMTANAKNCMTYTMTAETKKPEWLTLGSILRKSGNSKTCYIIIWDLRNKLMKTEIRDIMIGRDYTDKMNNKKTHWTRIGTLFIKTDDAGEVKIGGSFDALPAHGENFVAFLRKPYNPQGQGQATEGEQPTPKEEVPTIQLEEEGEQVRIEDVPF